MVLSIIYLLFLLELSEDLLQAGSQNGEKRCLMICWSEHFTSCSLQMFSLITTYAWHIFWYHPCTVIKACLNVRNLFLGVTIFFYSWSSINVVKLKVIIVSFHFLPLSIFLLFHPLPKPALLLLLNVSTLLKALSCYSVTNKAFY